MKTPPFHSNGCQYGTGLDGKRICLGARMGRASVFSPDFSGRLRCQRVRIDSGGYDRGGAYWGHGVQALYCAWADGVEFYTRARNRHAARAHVLAMMPQAKFFINVP